MQVTLRSWNLTVERMSWMERIRGWLWVMTVGNIWILLRMGPTTTGTFLRTVSEATRTSYCLAPGWRESG